jgi:hypothetical protein
MANEMYSKRIYKEINVRGAPIGETKQTNDLGVALERFEDRRTGERLLTEAGTNIGKNSSLDSVGLVEDVLERGIRRTKAVQKVLSEDPSAAKVTFVSDEVLERWRGRSAYL